MSLNKFPIHIVKIPTSMHCSATVHVLQGGSDLHKVLPNSLLRHHLTVRLKMLDHPSQISGISQLEDNNELIVINKRLQVSNDVWVVQALLHESSNVLTSQRTLSKSISLMQSFRAFSSVISNI